MTHYICKGSVRGQCKHKHTTVNGARECIRRDMKGCQSQGGYSDREVFAVATIVRGTVTATVEELVSA